MNQRLSGSRIPTFVWCLVLTAYLLPLALPVALMEDDEGLHAAVAQEMVAGGDWTVPRLEGKPFLDKPILYFWIEAASIATFGSSEFAVRLPGVLLAIAAVLAIAWLAARVAGAPAGNWAGLCYATMLLPYGVSLVPVHDLVMVPLVVIAIGSFWHARHAQSAAALTGWTLAAGLALGLSLLGKGLTGIGLVGVAVIAWLLWTRALTWRLVAVASAALALAALLALPWYLAMARAVPGYITYFFLQRHLEAVVGNTQPHAGRPAWYYLPLLIAGAWPWSLLLMKGIRRPLTDAERLFWCWLLADLAVLSLAGSKLVTYILPTMPAVAGLAAFGVIHDSRTLQRVARWAAIGGALLPPTAVLYLTKRYQIAGWPIAGLLVACTPVVALLWTFTRFQPRGWNAASRLALVTAATILATALAVRPIAASALTARELAAYFNRTGQLPSRLLIVDEGVGSFLFYLRPDLRRQVAADSVEKVSRRSLGDIHNTDGVVVAIAGRRIAAVADLYNLPASERTPEGGFLVLPLADLVEKAQ